MKKNILLIAICSVIFFSCDTEKVSDEKSKTNIADTTAAFAPKENTPAKAPVQNGGYEERHPNGLIKMKGEYAGGKRHGTWLSFYPDGKIWSEGAYINGLREGRAITYYPNGNKRYEGIYKNDKESGKWIYWDENGKLTKEIDYDKK